MLAAPDYKAMYLELFRANERAARLLWEAQQRAEQQLLDESPPPLHLDTEKPDLSAKGNADADEFMAEIEAQVRQLVKTYSCISADKQNLFQSERVIIGKCPRCSENVYEGKKNFYCGNRSCQFVMWKNDRFFEQRKKAFTPKIAAALLKNGKAKVKGLYSEKTGKTYDATVLLADTGGKYVNYRVERKE